MDTTHTQPLGLCTFYKHTRFFSFSPVIVTSRIMLQSFTTLSTLLLNPPQKCWFTKTFHFFSAQSLHFFYLGGILSVVLEKNNHFTPKEGFPKTAYLMALKSCQLRAFSVCESKRSHRIKTQNAQLSPFDLFQFGL